MYLNCRLIRKLTLRSKPKTKGFSVVRKKQYATADDEVDRCERHRDLNATGFILHSESILNYVTWLRFGHYSSVVKGRCWTEVHSMLHVRKFPSVTQRILCYEACVLCYTVKEKLVVQSVSIQVKY